MVTHRRRREVGLEDVLVDEGTRLAHAGLARERPAPFDEAGVDLVADAGRAPPLRGGDHDLRPSSPESRSIRQSCGPTPAMSSIASTTFCGVWT